MNEMEIAPNGDAANARITVLILVPLTYLIVVCWSDCFRRIFGYKRHEFVKELQLFCGDSLTVFPYYAIIFLLCINVRCIPCMSDKVRSANSVGKMCELVGQFFTSSLL